MLNISEPDRATTLQRQKIVRLRSFQGDNWYNISLDNKTCDCPNFQTKANGCEHLAALGIHRLRPFRPTAHPTFSQALSALVKSIRLRRLEDAVYWLVYLDSFQRKTVPVQDSTQAVDRFCRRRSFTCRDGRDWEEVLDALQTNSRPD